MDPDQCSKNTKFIESTNSEDAPDKSDILLSVEPTKSQKDLDLVKAPTIGEGRLMNTTTVTVTTTFETGTNYTTTFPPTTIFLTSTIAPITAEKEIKTTLGPHETDKIISTLENYLESTTEIIETTATETTYKYETSRNPTTTGFQTWFSSNLFSNPNKIMIVFQEILLFNTF